MGIFSGKKKIYVASTVYNMAGDPEERINFLKTVTIGSVLTGGRNFSMTDTLVGNYITGPGIKIRNFHRWCRNHYQDIGIPKLKIVSASGLDMPTIGTYVPRDAGQTVEVTYVRAGPGDSAYWAEQWVIDNHPDDIGLDWYSDYDSATNTITITWPDTSTDSFSPVNYSADDDYVYVVYALKTATSFLGSKMWIYRVGDGIGYLDSVTESVDTDDEVIPFIPIRLDGKFLSPTYKATSYNLAKKAYTKATGRRGKKGLDEIISKIKENDSIDDIDHAYMVFGVALNTKDNASLKYIFKFFDLLRTGQSHTSSTFEDWDLAQDEYEVEAGDFETSREALGDPGGPTDPATTSTVPAAPVPPVTSITIKNPGAFDTKLHMKMHWQNITKETGTGLAKPGAKVGEVWWGNLTTRSIQTSLFMVLGAVYGISDRSTLRLYYQKTANSWERLSIAGLEHENLIYKDKEVRITGGEALVDDEESGFLVPIHYGTLKKMSLVDSTQMMTASNYLVFNSYEVVKQKWYQTWWFKVLLFVVVIAITVITMGAAAPGLLGTALAVGTAVGLTGLAAVIAGAVINALAAMLLMSLITRGATALFGEKLGAVIAAVVAIVAMSVGSGLMNGQSLTTMWGNMMSATNLIQMTSAVGNGIAGYMKASAQETMVEMQAMNEKYEAELKKIHDMFVKEFGMGDFHFDPMNLTNVNMGGVTESPQSFLDRTLLTGTDIAQMSIDMLHNFTDTTLSVDTIGG
jgi:hypothetical protein